MVSPAARCPSGPKVLPSRRIAPVVGAGVLLWAPRPRASVAIYQRTDGVPPETVGAAETVRAAETVGAADAARAGGLLSPLPVPARAVKSW